MTNRQSNIFNGISLYISCFIQIFPFNDYKFHKEFDKESHEIALKLHFSP